MTHALRVADKRMPWCVGEFTVGCRTKITQTLHIQCGDFFSNVQTKTIFVLELYVTIQSKHFGTDRPPALLYL